MELTTEYDGDDEANITQIVLSIKQMTDVDSDKIVVGIDVSDSLNIIVFVNEKNTANKIVGCIDLCRRNQGRSTPPNKSPISFH